MIGSERLNGNDTVRLKVELSAEDLPTFLAHAPVESEAFAAGSGGYLGRDHGFWDPQSTVGIATVGVEGVGPVKNLDAYFDNVLVSVRQ